MTAEETGISPVKKSLKQVEYELILFAFLLLRFVFKNVLGFRLYFAQERVFGLSENGSIVLGCAVLAAVCLYLAALGGRMLRREKKEEERPLILLVCLLFACPAALPFLFDTDNVSGAQMLYPFALFLLAAFCAGNRIGRWFTPVICVLFFVPAAHSGEVFFAVLRKGALLYVPLILLLLYLKAYTAPAAAAKKRNPSKTVPRPGRDLKLPAARLIFISACILSALAYAYTLYRGKRYNEAFFDNSQTLGGYFLIALAVCAPFLAAAGWVLFSAAADRRVKRALVFIGLAASLLLVLCAENYFGLWIPFLVIGAALVVFEQAEKQNTAMMPYMQRFGDFCWKYNYLFFIILLATALFTDTTSQFISDTARAVFDKIPY